MPTAGAHPPARSFGDGLIIYLLYLFIPRRGSCRLRGALEMVGWLVGWLIYLFILRRGSHQPVTPWGRPDWGGTHTLEMPPPPPRPAIPHPQHPAIPGAPRAAATSPHPPGVHPSSPGLSPPPPAPAITPASAQTGLSPLLYANPEPSAFSSSSSSRCVAQAGAGPGGRRGGGRAHTPPGWGTGLAASLFLTCF